MSKKTKQGRTRHSSSTHGSGRTRNPKPQKLSANEQQVITGEIMGALLGAITFGALQE